MTGMLGVMTLIQCVYVRAASDILESVRDVICIHMMSCIFYLCYHTFNEGYMIGNLGVMTEIQWMSCVI